MDPPFKETEINQMIEIIKEKKMLKKDGIFIIHRHKKDDIEIKKNINIFEERNYGISKIIIGS
jgi:16S rRNA (guanine966-N2)-methyltransferase